MRYLIISNIKSFIDLSTKSFVILRIEPLGSPARSPILGHQANPKLTKNTPMHSYIRVCFGLATCLAFRPSGYELGSSKRPSAYSKPLLSTMAHAISPLVFYSSRLGSGVLNPTHYSNILPLVRSEACALTGVL